MDVPTGSNPKYVDCLEVLKNNPFFIIKNIQANYSQKDGKNEEDISEKKIQGDMICRQNSLFLDSEFAHRYEIGKRQTIRFDLVMIKNNQLIFIELKRIKDNRMLNKEDDKPEILEQMDKYQKFIKVNKDKLLDYYKTLYEIKSSLTMHQMKHWKKHLVSITSLLWDYLNHTRMVAQIYQKKIS